MGSARRAGPLRPRPADAGLRRCAALRRPGRLRRRRHAGAGPGGGARGPGPLRTRAVRRRAAAVAARRPHAGEDGWRPARPQRGRRRRRGLRDRPDPHRCRVRHALPEPRADGAACQPGGLGRAPGHDLLLVADGGQPPGRRRRHAADVEGQRPHRQPLHRRRLRRQAALLRRPGAGGDRREAARPSGQGRLHPPADVPPDHAPHPDLPAPADRRRPRRHAAVAVARGLDADRARRQLRRERGAAHPPALSLRQHRHRRPRGAARPAAVGLDARPRRRGRLDGARMRPRRAGRAHRPRPGGAAAAQRHHGRSDPAPALHQPPPGGLPEAGGRPLRLGAAAAARARAATATG